MFKKILATKKKAVVVKKKKSAPSVKKGKMINCACSESYTEEQQAMIRERAYYLWERKGYPDNSHENNWVEAEQELKKEGLL
jgi:hypothetical protein